MRAEARNRRANSVPAAGRAVDPRSGGRSSGLRYWGPGPGAPPTPRCSPMPVASVTLWARRESVAASVRRDHLNNDYLPGRSAARERRRHFGFRRGAGGRGRSGARRAESGAAGEPAGVPGFPPADGADRVPGQGRGDRYRPADERGDRQGRPGRSGPDRGADRARTWRSRSPSAGRRRP